MSAILRNIKTLPEIRHEEASTSYFKNCAHFSHNPCQSFMVHFFSVSLHMKRNHERRQAICALFVYYDQPRYKDALLSNITDSDFVFGRNVVITIRQIQNPVKITANRVN